MTIITAPFQNPTLRHTKELGITPVFERRSIYAVGKADQQYTLWKVSVHGEVIVSYYYIQNLSTIKDIAIAKAVEIAQPTEYTPLIITGLRGVSRYEAAYDSYPTLPNLMVFGKYRTQFHEIVSVEDVIVKHQDGSYLKWYMQTIAEKMKTYPLLWGEHYEYVRGVMRKFELLVEFDGSEVYLQDIPKIIKERDADSWIWGLHAPSGERVVLDILSVKKVVSFEGAFGVSTAVTLVCPQSRRAYTYVGTCSFEWKEGTYVSVKGTIAHKTYRGVDQTTFKRPTVKELKF